MTKYKTIRFTEDQAVGVSLALGRYLASARVDKMLSTEDCLDIIALIATTKSVDSNIDLRIFDGFSLPKIEGIIKGSDGVDRASFGMG